MTKQQLIAAFLNAVNNWKAYVKALKEANKANNSVMKKILGAQMFFWRKESEKFKKMLDFSMFAR